MDDKNFIPDMRKEVVMNHELGFITTEEASKLLEQLSAILDADIALTEKKLDFVHSLTEAMIKEKA